MLEAEALGYDSTLIAQHTINPHGERDQLEAWTAAAALAGLTSADRDHHRHQAAAVPPVVLAKMALQIEHISKGRFALNLVNAWNRPEIERAGIPFPEHDARYAYGREWIEVVRRLMQGERLTFQGEHFTVDGYQLRPADPFRARPRIYVGGEVYPRAGPGRGPGRCLVHQRPAARGRAGADRRHGGAGRATGRPPLRFGLSAFVIARRNPR